MDTHSGYGAEYNGGFKGRDWFTPNDVITEVLELDNELRITLVAGGYPLFANGKIAGGISVGGGTEEQDREIAEYVVSVFDKLVG